MTDRCPSCDHLIGDHAEDGSGCLREIVAVRPGADRICLCTWMPPPATGPSMSARDLLGIAPEWEGGRERRTDADIVAAEKRGYRRAIERLRDDGAYRQFRESPRDVPAGYVTPQARRQMAKYLEAGDR